MNEWATEWLPGKRESVLEPADAAAEHSPPKGCNEYVVHRGWVDPEFPGVAKIEDDVDCDSVSPITPVWGVSHPDGRSFALKCWVSGLCCTLCWLWLGGLAPVAWGQAGSLDRSFPAGSGPNGAVRDLVELPDGKLLVAGDFSRWDGVEAARVVRVFPDGRLDPSFRLSLGREGPLPPASSLVLGRDGGIFVEFRDFTMSLSKLLPDGSADPTYPGLVQPMYSILLSDGSVLGLAPGFNDNTLLRWGPSGEPMPGFQHRLTSTYLGRVRPGTVEFARLDGQGRLLLKGGFGAIDGISSGFARLHVGGAFDTQFSPEVVGTVFWLLPDGGFLHLLSGTWPQVQLSVRRTTGEFRVDPAVRVQALLDAPAAPQPGPLIVKDVAWQTDGKYLLAGSFSTVNGQPRPHVVRLHPDGVVDEGFEVGSGFEYGAGAGYSNNVVECVVAQAGGGVVVGGEFLRVQGVPRAYIARLSGGPPGEPPHWIEQPLSRTNDELSVATLTVSAEGAEPIAYRWQRDGRDLAGRTNAVFRLPLVRPSDAGDYRAIASNPFGSITSTVATLTILPAEAPGLSVETLRVQASPGGSPVLRATVSGRPAPGVQWYRGDVPVPGATQAVWKVANVRVADAGIYRVEAANALGRATGPDVTLEVSPETAFPGRVDVAFSPPAIPGIRSMSVGPGGRLVVGGTFTEVAGVPRRGVARLLPDGGLDPEFDPGGGPSGGQTICCPDAEYLGMGTVMAVAALSDGGVLVGGNFSSFAGRGVSGLVRLRANGTIDEAFAAENRGVRGDIGPAVLSLLAEPDGSLLAGGYFTVPTSRLVRWLSDGRVDSVFRVGLGATGGRSFQKADVPFPMPLDGTHVRALVRLPDGRLLVGGNFGKFGGEVRAGLARLLADGQVDPTFVPDLPPGLVRSLGIDASGRIYVGSELPGEFLRPGPGRVERLALDGRRDPSFSLVELDSRVTALVVQPDGAVVIAGQFTRVNGVARRGIARVLSNGAVDAGFSLSEDGQAPSDQVLSLRDDGSVWVAGGFDGFHGVPRSGLARLHGGAVPEAPPVLIEEPVDAATREGGSVVFRVVAASGGSLKYQWLHNGKALARAEQSSLSLSNVRLDRAGDYAVVVSNAWGAITSRWVRLTVEPSPRLPGSVDPDFDAGRPPASGGSPLVLTVTPQADGRVLLTGVFANGPGSGCALDRWGPDGAPEAAPPFPVALGSFPTTVVVQPVDGRILVAPSGVGITAVNGFGVTRFLPDGRVDPGFQMRVGPGGTEVRAFALQGDGSILVGGSFQTLNGAAQSYLGRITSGGVLDAGFAPRVGLGGDLLSPPVSHVVVQPDGRILVAGSFRSINQVGRAGLARILVDGQLDADFVLRSAPALPVSALALDHQGRILVAFAGAAGSSQVMGRWQPDGTPDFGFTIPLIRGPSGAGSPTVRTFGFDGGGRVVIGGDFEAGDASRPYRNIARLLAEGPLDVAWNASPGTDSSVTDLRVTADDGVYLAGSFSEVQGLSRRGVARLLGGTVSSGPRLDAPRLGAGGLGFTVSTRAGHRYTVETSDTLGAPWLIEGEAIPGDGLPRAFSIPLRAGVGARFVRVRED